MMKKIVALIMGIMVLSVTSGALAADEILPPNAGMEEVSIKAVLDTLTKPLTLKVYELNGNDTDGWTVGDLVHIDQLNEADGTTSADGEYIYTKTEDNKYIYTFENFSTPASGRYRAIVKNSVSRDFKVVSLEDKRTYYVAMQGKTASDLKAHIEYGITGELLTADMGGYMTYTDTETDKFLTKVNTTLIAALPTSPVLTSESTLVNVVEYETKIKANFEDIIELADILNTSSESFDSVIRANAAGLGLDINTYYYYDSTDVDDIDYKINPKEVCVRLRDLNPAINKTAISEAFNVAVLLEIAETCDYGTLTDALKHYDGEGITLDHTYDIGMSETKLDEISIEMQKSASSFKTAADIEASYLEWSEKVSKRTSGVVSTVPDKTPSGGTTSPGSIVITPPVNTEPSTPAKPVDTTNPVVTGTFKDISGVEWARDAIEYLAKEGVISGRDNENYAPDDNVTREEFVKIIVNAFNLAMGDSQISFNDVEIGRWSESFIKIAASNGIISGVTDTEFAPTATLLREQMAAIIFRVYAMDGKEMPEPKEFADNDEIDDYAKEAVGVLAAEGIIDGMDNNEYAPKALVTRAQAAKIVYETLVAIGAVK